MIKFALLMAALSSVSYGMDEEWKKEKPCVCLEEKMDENFRKNLVLEFKKLEDSIKEQGKFKAKPLLNKEEQKQLRGFIYRIKDINSEEDIFKLEKDGELFDFLYAKITLALSHCSESTRNRFLMFEDFINLQNRRSSWKEENLPLFEKALVRLKAAHKFYKLEEIRCKQFPEEHNRLQDELYEQQADLEIMDLKHVFIRNFSNYNERKNLKNWLHKHKIKTYQHIQKMDLKDMNHFFGIDKKIENSLEKKLEILPILKPFQDFVIFQSKIRENKDGFLFFEENSSYPSGKEEEAIVRMKAVLEMLELRSKQKPPQKKMLYNDSKENNPLEIEGNRESDNIFDDDSENIPVSIQSISKSYLHLLPMPEEEVFEQEDPDQETQTRFLETMKIKIKNEENLNVKHKLSFLAYGPFDKKVTRLKSGEPINAKVFSVKFGQMNLDEKERILEKLIREVKFKRKNTGPREKEENGCTKTVRKRSRASDFVLFMQILEKKHDNAFSTFRNKLMLREDFESYIDQLVSEE